MLYILLMVNLIAFALFGLDKQRAVQGRWRISEKSLLASCLPFSAFGGYAGMRIFHHKTRKPVFSIGVPVMMAMQAGLIWWMLAEGTTLFNVSFF